ncbi:DUF2391 domain-containing protein [Haloglomus litoreum]|uniref:DUF2391 domain-containing protein n=1 Tax=Haloglomus litoreum TaxID=3034026 RepID=UPI0023E7B1B4|nr:DUF2391 domain-containing protein [Haloglomus sp. DT116]
MAEDPDADPPTGGSADAATAGEELPPRPLGDPPPTASDVLDELEALAGTVDDPEEREAVERAKLVLGEMQAGPFGNVVYGFDRADAAEALLGALLFGIPMFVEGGTLEVGTFVAANPLALVGTLGASVALTIGILYVADFQDVRVYRPLLGFIPRRLAGILVISLLTALVAMTAWGRLDWSRPWLSFCQASVALVPMVIGAALGDLLPGS